MSLTLSLLDSNRLWVVYLCAGLKSLTLQDTRAATIADLSANYFLREADVGQNRALVVVALPRVRELNSYVNVSSCCEPLSSAIIKKLDIDVRFTSFSFCFYP